MRAALALVPGADTVLIHEPDRPLVTAAVVDGLLSEAAGAAAAVTVLPVHSSIKRVLGDAIVETVPRNRLYSIQSPSRFDRSTLERILSQASPTADVHELELVRAAGIDVRLVPGSHYNVPVTSSADARFAELAVRHSLVVQPAG